MFYQTEENDIVFLAENDIHFKNLKNDSFTITRGTVFSYKSDFSENNDNFELTVQSYDLSVSSLPYLSSESKRSPVYISEKETLPVNQTLFYDFISQTSLAAKKLTKSELEKRICKNSRMQNITQSLSELYSKKKELSSSITEISMKTSRPEYSYDSNAITKGKLIFFSVPFISAAILVISMITSIDFNNKFTEIMGLITIASMAAVLLDIFLRDSGIGDELYRSFYCFSAYMHNNLSPLNVKYKKICAELENINMQIIEYEENLNNIFSEICTEVFSEEQVNTKIPDYNTERKPISLTKK